MLTLEHPSDAWSRTAARFSSLTAAMAEKARQIAGSGRLQAFIFGVIVFNAVVLGLGS